MNALRSFADVVTCARCGEPVDSRPFDASGFADFAPGARLVLARFELPRRFCGRLEHFAQFTDQFAANPANVETPEVSWSILANGQPLAPYVDLRAILNPWGFGSYPTDVRLDDATVLEFVVRASGAPPGPGAVARVGGRLVGRYWYNAACTHVDRHG